MFARNDVAQRKVALRIILPLLAIMATWMAAASAQAEFGITHLSNETLNADGEDDTRAGAHPYELVTTIDFTQTTNSSGAPIPTENLKEMHVELPPGFVGDPTAVPQCTDAQLDVGACPVTSQVGLVSLPQAIGQPLASTLVSPLYNVEAPPGEPAQFGFVPGIFPIRSHASVRTDSDYGISYDLHNVPQPTELMGSKVTLWGVPPDSGHDDERGQECQLVPPFGEFCRPVLGGSPGPIDIPHKPFLTNPTSCEGAALKVKAVVASWQQPNVVVDEEADSPATTNCDEVEFEPSLKARPTTNAADSPSGLDVDLRLRQNEGPEALATAQLRDAVVTLPEGLVVNPSSANGLGACTPAQIGLTTAVGDPKAHFNLAKPSCPDAASIGRVEVDTPVFPDPLKGNVYLASPHQNPFGSLLALYLAIEGHGLVIKLPGKVTADPQTGRLSTSFEENPQVPVKALRLNLFAGSVAPLRNPANCGTYTTTSVMTPWSAPDSGPPATPSDTYKITQGANGQPCGAPANAPSFSAGSVAPLAGNYQPFVVNLRREDGTQQFSSVTVTPPPGLVAKLAGTATCSDAQLAAAAAKSGNDEKNNPSCPTASEIGSVYAQAGAGPAPYNAPGKAYLTGPYKGAPLSLAIVTPATAGPFDLGTIVVRTALFLDPKTAQVKAVSDPIPTILQGIPLDIRAVSIRLDKPGFTLNPSSCDPSTVDGSLLSTAGATAALQSRFQLAECGQLKFKPSLALSLKGPTKRAKYPALTAVLTPRPGDANIAAVSVALPHSEFLAQEHIRTVCTRVQWAADQCPAAAIYGKVSVTTPLLDYPLTGPVYLRSSDNPLPDLVPDLRGPANQPIRFEAAGKTDSVKGGIRNSFAFVPDVPFTKLVLQLQGGKKGLLVNSRDICAQTNKADVSYTAHNGLSYSATPALKAKCGGKGRKKGKGKPKHGKGKPSHHRG
jgi:hypothetical protein